MTDTKKRNRRMMIALMAAISSVAIIVPLLSALLGLFGASALQQRQIAAIATDGRNGCHRP